MTKYSEWKIHDGGACPVPEGTRGQVVRREDTVAGVSGKPPKNLSTYRWERAKIDDPYTYSYLDIFAYRTVIEPKTYDVWVCVRYGEWVGAFTSHEEALDFCNNSSGLVLGPRKVTFTEGKRE